jgi:arylsulfatase A
MRLTSFRLIAAAVAVIALGASISHATERPNVVLIITDDQGYGDLSVHGNPYLRTPNIDSIAQGGIQFERFYVSTFCAPTRAALLTGRYPLRCSVWGVTLNKEAMRPQEVTLAETLRDAGYRTACIGKWHNGEQYPFTPPGQGFEEFLGFCNGHTNDYFDALLRRGAEPEPSHGYITDVLTDEAIRFIAADHSRPFFCYVSCNAPHSPYQVPDRYFDKFAATGKSATVAAFYGMCENIDDNVGRILATLNEHGLEENTIVIFLTDNGGTAGTSVYNAGMRGGKTSVHEGGSRVPLFVRWPARFRTPGVVRQIASHIDIYPTVLALCGVALPEKQPTLDGVSLIPLMEGKPGDWPDRTLFTHNPISEHNRYPGAVRTQRYRLLREIEGPAGGSAAVENDRSATSWQLYDMQVDPGEKHDLASENPDLVAELSRQYENWLDEVSKQGLRRYPIPVGYAAENPVTLQAHQAYFDGGLLFFAGAGYAHDYLTNWTNSDAKIWFDIDVAQPGEFEVTLLYGCSAADAGSTVKVTTNSSSVANVILPAEAPVIPLPHRDAAGHKHLVIRDWQRLPLGQLHLDSGSDRLVLQAANLKGDSVMDFKGVELRRLD